MPMKGSGVATDWREIDRWDGGVGWMAYPDETMQRASHALVEDGEVWLVDPVDVEGLDALLEDLGTVAGTVVLLDRHGRDAGAIARRHDVAVHVPEWMRGVDGTDGARTAPLEQALAGTEYRVHTLVDNPFWQEAALWGADSKTLVVTESLGTTSYFRTHAERLGVHPARRLVPPRSLRRFDPERVLVGHGEGIREDASGALQAALAGSRRRTPRLYAKTVREFLL